MTARGKSFLTDGEFTGKLRACFGQKGSSSWESVESGRFRSSAVLVPLFRDGEELSTLFTVRPGYLRRHPGQISFPGGAREETDASPGSTALREAGEELGFTPSEIRILGTLPPEVAFTSDFLIVPVIGWVAPEVAYGASPDSQEVERLIRTHLKLFSSTPSLEWKKDGGLSFVYPVFPLGNGDRVWGVTARILLRLVRMLRHLGAC